MRALDPAVRDIIWEAFWPRIPVRQDQPHLAAIVPAPLIGTASM